MEPTYQVFNDRVVKCTLKCTAIFEDIDTIVPSEVELPSHCDLLYCYKDKGKYMEAIILTTTGIAKCDESDTFCEETGRRIAESKASIKAYSLLKKLLFKANERLLDMVRETTRDYARASILKKTEMDHLYELTEEQ